MNVSASIRVHIVIAVSCAAAISVHAEDLLYHGAPLDEQYSVQLEQEYNSIRIGLVQRTRVTGEQYNIPLGTVGVTQRRTPKPKFLCEVRVQILQSSAPNYIQNPGQRYRITVLGIELAPDYGNQVDVYAAQARDTMYFEIDKLAQLATGIERDALYAAAPLAIDAFKAAQLMPAEIFESVLRSRGGRFRITEDTLQVRRISPTELFAPSLTIERPRLGATLRAEEREELPRGAAGVPFTRGFRPSSADIGIPRPDQAPGIPSELDEQYIDVQQQRRIPVQPLKESDLE